MKLFISTWLMCWVPFFLFWLAVCDDPSGPFLTFWEMTAAATLAAIFVTSVRASARRLL